MMRLKKFANRGVLGLTAMAVLAAGALFYAEATAAEPAQLASENAYLRQIINHLGSDPVDIYASIEDAANRKPAFEQVKIMPPVVILDKLFYPVRDAKGELVYLSPGRIAAIRPTPGSPKAEN
jgi:hypothetical protein